MSRYIWLNLANPIEGFMDLFYTGYGFPDDPLLQYHGYQKMFRYLRLREARAADAKHYRSQPVTLVIQVKIYMYL
jgi:hypothetical protein